MYSGGNKPSELKIQIQSEDNIIKNIRNLFQIKNENEQIKGRIIRYIKNLLEQEGEDYEPVRVTIIVTIVSNMKVMVIEMKPYQSMNSLLKLNHTWKHHKLSPKIWHMENSMSNSFISSKDTDKEHVIHSKSVNIEIMACDKADEVV